jgi:hypothetical protein
VHSDPDNLPEKLALHAVDGTFLEWVDETLARKLIKDGTVEILRTKRRIRSLRVRAEKRAELVSITKSKFDLAHRKRPVGQSHRNETEQNPPKVWTIDPIPRRAEDLFVFSLSGKRAA